MGRSHLKEDKCPLQDWRGGLQSVKIVVSVEMLQKIWL